jgi:hypothetical protein
MTDLPNINFDNAVDLSQPTEAQIEAEIETLRIKLIDSLTTAVNSGEVELSVLNNRQLTAVTLGLMQALAEIHGVEIAHAADLWADVFTTVMDTAIPDA